MTNIKFRCPDCGKKLSAPETSVGRQSHCPKCGTKFTVPSAEHALRRAKQAAADGPATEHALLLIPSMPAHREDLIDMTAMVDIVFFLLIFFLVTSMQSLESVINLPSPQASADSSAIAQPLNYLDDPSFIVVTIDEEDVIWVDDKEVFGEQGLRSKLRAARKDEDRTGLLVIGDPDATHGTLVGVLDAGADAGIKELLFSVSEQPEETGG